MDPKMCESFNFADTYHIQDHEKIKNSQKFCYIVIQL